MPSRRNTGRTDCPYHIVARTSNKDWFEVPMPVLWDLFSNHLHSLHHWSGFQIHSFVLMNNHFHLIATIPNGNCGIAMNYFMRETSKSIARMSGRINQIYGRPYYASALKTNHYYLNAYKYLYRNPVDAGLCKKVESYPYSTLNCLLGLSKANIPIAEDTLLFDDTESNLKWLNKEYPSEDIRKIIATALRHKEFKFPVDKNRKPHELEFKLV